MDYLNIIITKNDIINDVLHRINIWLDLQTEHLNNKHKRSFIIQFIYIWSNWKIRDENKNYLQNKLETLVSKESMNQQLKDLIININSLFAMYYYKFEYEMRDTKLNLNDRIDELFFLSVLNKFKNEIQDKLVNLESLGSQQLESLVSLLPEIKNIDEKVSNNKNDIEDFIEKLTLLKYNLRQTLEKYINILYSLDNTFDVESFRYNLIQYVLLFLIKKINETTKENVTLNKDESSHIHELRFLLSFTNQKFILADNKIDFFNTSKIQDLYEIQDELQNVIEKSQILRHKLISNLKIEKCNIYKTILIVFLKENIASEETYIYLKNQNIKRIGSLYRIVNEFIRLYKFGKFMQSESYSFEQHHISSVKTTLDLLMKKEIELMNNHEQQYIKDIIIFSEKFIAYS